MPLSKGPGRPPKFAGPSRVVTVTLPEETLRKLESLDKDRARAIVRATEIAADVATETTPDLAAASVEMVAATADLSLITVPYSQALSEIAGLELIRVAPARHLIVLKPGTPLAQIELELLDRAEALGPGDCPDRSILLKLLARLREFRRAERATTAEVILVAI